MYPKSVLFGDAVEIVEMSSLVASDFPYVGEEGPKFLSFGCVGSSEAVLQNL
jgi:hypothetical protein